MTEGYNKNEIANELGRPPSWISEQLQKLHDELLLQSNLFFPLTPSEHQALTDSIERHGVQTPIIIGQHITLIDGRHRTLISQALGHKDIPAVFLLDTTPEQERELAITLNAARRQLTTKQKETLVQAELTRNPARTDRLIASICGVSNTYVRDTRATMHHQQQAEATINAEVQFEHTGLDMLANPPNLYPATRTDRAGRTQTEDVPTGPPIAKTAAPIAYLTCAHGQTHSLIRDRDGYRLEVSEDR